MRHLGFMRMLKFEAVNGEKVTAWVISQLLVLFRGKNFRQSNEKKQVALPPTPSLSLCALFPSVKG